jgi:hypothetical protein
VGYDLDIWKERADSRVDPAYTYSLLSEDAEASHLESCDWLDFRKALDEAYPDWRSPDAAFICDFSTTHVSVSIPFSVVDEVVPALRALAQEQGLTVFDPQRQPIPSAVAQQARRDARAWRDRELREHRGAEMAAITARADAGDPLAQLDLANRLSTGEGVRKNLSKAFLWYKAAAESANVDAMFNLAACYQYGDGTPPDLAEAIHWYEKASAKDATYATSSLGDIFLGCGSVPRDNAKAKAYFSEALQNGHPDAAAALRLLDEPDITIDKKKRVWKFVAPREVPGKGSGRG